MGILNNGRKIKYKYQVTEFELLFDKEIQKVGTERITAISILNDYVTNVFPVFSIKVALESQLYYKIIKNKKTVRFHIRLQKYYKGMTGGESVSLMRDCINDTFQLILDDDDSDLEASLRKQQNKMNYSMIDSDQINQLDKISNICEFFLYKSSTVRSCSKLINNVLEKATLTDAITYTLSESGIKNVLLSPLDNSTKYNEILIPPLKMIKALKFLDTYYGFYKSGSVIFFGLDRNYILRYQGGCSAYERDEIVNTTIIIPEKTEGIGEELYTILPKEKGTINYLSGSMLGLSSRDDSVSGDLLYGNRITVVGSDNGDIETFDNGSEFQSNTKVFVNKTENQYMGEIYKNQSDSTTGVIQTILSNYDMDMITPNKRFNVIFEDSTISNKYKGNYILTSVNHKLVKDGSELIATADVTLRKNK